MAIIKCPECGQQTSDKAPVCPHCGVEIAGKITRCAQCGEVYFSNRDFCPECHHATHDPGQPGPADTDGRQGRPKPGKKKTGVCIAALCTAILTGGIVFYCSNSAKAKKENEAYMSALKADDAQVLQTYLDNHRDAPEDHRAAIMARLDGLKKQDAEWTNALVSDSRTALEYYLARHPDSDHAVEAAHKIDSIDWADASNGNSAEAIQLYLARHANGEHVDEANAALKKIKAKTVQNEDRKLVTASLQRFFQSVNARDEDRLESSVTPVMVNFLGKRDASKADVVTFMNKIYKEDITNMNWHLDDECQISKKEIGDEQYEYTVDVSAVQKIERTDNSKEKEARFRIKATINPDGRISAMTMTKILE